MPYLMQAILEWDIVHTSPSPSSSDVIRCLLVVEDKDQFIHGCLEKRIMFPLVGSLGAWMASVVWEYCGLQIQQQWLESLNSRSFEEAPSCVFLKEEHSEMKRKKPFSWQWAVLSAAANEVCFKRGKVKNQQWHVPQIVRACLLFTCYEAVNSVEQLPDNLEFKFSW